MGASSVTGIGNGSALKGNMEMSKVPLSITNLVGPKIAAAGKESMNESEIAVEFPAPSGNIREYAVFLQSSDAEGAHLSRDLGMVDGSNWGFSIFSAKKSSVSWMVVKLGLA